jgi:hypothetical protein
MWGILARVAVAVIIMVAWYFAANAISDSKAYDVARDLGYTNVHIDGTSIVMVELRGCGKYDQKLWHVTADNVRGQRIHFTVCAGWFSGGKFRSN